MLKMGEGKTKLVKRKSGFLKTSAVLLGLSIALGGCGSGGGGGGDNSSTSNSDLLDENDSTQKVSNFSTINVQAGYVDSSEVIIRTFDGVVLYTGITDSSGNLIIDNEKFKEALTKNGLNEKSYFIVEAFYGIDTDPDDDGDIDNDIDIIIDGVMGGVMNFTQLSNAIINPISSQVKDILIGINGENLDSLKDDNGNINVDKTEIRIKKILEEIGVVDIDKDGEITIKDVINYDMVKHDSPLEEQLRQNGYLGTIHSGDDEERRRLIQIEKNNINLIATNILVTDGDYYLTLSGSDTNGYIDYSYDGATWIQYYSGDEIDIQRGEIVYYREEYSNDGGFSKMGVYQLTQDQIDNEEQLNNNGEISGQPKAEGEIQIEDSIGGEVSENTGNVSSGTVGSGIESGVETGSNTGGGNESGDLGNEDGRDNEQEIIDQNQGIEISDFSIEHEPIVEGPIGESLIINWYDLGIIQNSNNLNIVAKIKSGDGAILELDGNNLQFRPRNNTIRNTEIIVLELSDESGWTENLIININNVSTQNLVSKKLYLSPDYIENPEEDLYKEYWTSMLEQPTWLNSYIRDDGYRYINKKDRWITTYTTVYGIDIEYKYYQVYENKSNASIYSNTMMVKYSNHDFTGPQKYLRPDGVRVDFNIGGSREDRGTATVRRFLEKQDYFFDQLSPEQQQNMLEKWEDIANWVPLEDREIIIETSVEEEDENIATEVVVEEEVNDIVILAGENVEIIESQEFVYDLVLLEDKLGRATQTYVASKEFELIDNKNFNTDFIFSKKHSTLPFTYYIKFNRVGNGNDFPALVWIEYKNDGNVDIPYTTSRIEVNNLEHLKEVLEFLQGIVTERIDLMNVGYQEELNEESFSNLEGVEFGEYVINSSNNKIIEGIRESGEEFSAGFKDGIRDGAVDSVEGIKDSMDGLKTYGILLIDSIAFWESKIMYGITGNSIYDDVTDMLNDKILDQSVLAVSEIEKFKAQLSELNELVEQALLNLDKIDNPEYRGGYINGYIDTLIAEGVAMTIVTKNAMTAINMLKGTKAYIRLKRLCDKINVAGEIAKFSLNRVDFDLLNTSINNVEIIRFKEIVTSTFIGYSAAKKGRFFERILLMDDFMQKEYFDNIHKYAETFEIEGIYNNLKKIELDGSITSINYDGEKFRLFDGIRVQEEFNYVIIDGKIIFGEKHSFLSGGRNVDYAGSIKFSQTGKISRVDNGSGHYKPSYSDISIVRDTLEDQYGFDTSNIQFINYNFNN